MIISVQLNDDLAATYQEEATERDLTLGQVLVDRLNRAGQLDPRDRYVILCGNTRDRMEQTLGGGHIQSAEDLLLKVGRLARIKFGDHAIPMTAGQAEELAHRAHKRGVPVSRLIEEIWTRMAPDFFNNVR